MIWGEKEQWDPPPRGAPKGAGGEQREPWGWVGGEGMLRALLAPWQGLEGAGKALFKLHLKYSLKCGILEPLWELWEGLPWEGDALGRAHPQLC